MEYKDKALLLDVLRHFELDVPTFDLAQVDEEINMKAKRMSDSPHFKNALNGILSKLKDNTLTEYYEQKAQECDTFEAEYIVYLEYQKKYERYIRELVANVRLSARQLSNTIDLFAMKTTFWQII